MNEYMMGVLLATVCWVSLGIIGWLPNSPEVRDLVEQCQQDLPRTEKCMLIAVPVKGADQ